jgi:hypothetical protein
MVLQKHLAQVVVSDAHIKKMCLLLYQTLDIFVPDADCPYIKQYKLLNMTESTVCLTK